MRRFISGLLFLSLIALAALWLRPVFVNSDVAQVVSPPGVVVQTAKTWALFHKENPPSSPVAPSPIEPNTHAPVLKLIRGHVGYWRLAQTQSDVWWFLSPEGKLEFLNGVSDVQPFILGRDPVGPHFISKDYNGGTTETGDLNAWASATLKRTAAYGFKSLGVGSHPILHSYPVPMTRDLNVWSSPAAFGKKFYSFDFDSAADRAIRAQAMLLKDNTSLIGYFIDSDIDWSDAVAGPGAYFDNLPANDPNRRQVVSVIQSIWPGIEAFNKDWNTSLKTFGEMDGWPSIPRNPMPAYVKLQSAWLSQLAHDYLQLTCTRIRQYDPNHLILGIRFKQNAPLEVVRASREFTDAESIDYSASDAKLDADTFRTLYEESRQPVILTGFTFHALDGRSGNRNLSGSAAQVPDQIARADGYRLLTTRAARLPFVVGAEWSQWADEPPSGRASDGQDLNLGVVDIDDRPYPALVDSVRSTSRDLNKIHEGSSNNKIDDVWRESYAAKPIMNVPYLPKAVALNAELSDWPAESKVPGIKQSQTVGVERSTTSPPNLYLGWSQEGLYLGMEVFDKDIQAGSAKGNWWSRDSVELLLSTRPFASDQDNYDPYSHRFFFLPQESPAAGLASGLLGQQHQPGDALKESLAPHPQVKDAVRLLHDRYVVEMFIPGKAMNGWNPQVQPAMAFNLLVHDYQHANDFFWSAPPQTDTQLHPKTWGTLYLQPATKPTSVSAAIARP